MVDPDPEQQAPRRAGRVIARVAETNPHRHRRWQAPQCIATMKCQELLARLSDYVDGDLDRNVYEAFRAHLDGCTPCEVVIDNIRQTITLYKCGQPAELPHELQGHLHRVLREQWQKHFPASGS